MKTCSVSFWNNFSSIFLFSVLFSSLLPFTSQQHTKPLTTPTKFLALSRRFLNELAGCFQTFLLYTAAHDENQVNYVTEVRLAVKSCIMRLSPYVFSLLKLRFATCSYQVCCYCYLISRHCSKEEEEKKVKKSPASLTFSRFKDEN